MLLKYLLIITFNASTEAKTISDKDTRAWVSTVFAFNVLSQEKQESKIMGTVPTSRFGEHKQSKIPIVTL
jgi:hypothetical protein